MLDKKVVRLKVEKVLKEDINYRLCSCCINYNRESRRGVCSLKQKRSNTCSFMATNDYYNQVLVKFKKREAKAHIEDCIIKTFERNEHALKEFGLYPDEINDLKKHFIKESNNE